MTWQELAVAVIVACAMAFLVRRILGRRRPRKPAETFVPLSSLRSSGDERSDKPGCH
jgi:hypothetical protein